ncbi:putative O-linked N-acetylglucosamine transferase (SPINDLY family) [Neisseria perflava]|uniref:O-linked N-acetylglucosamine transferase, SPINDLY family protein n=1 Tax=Neisseria perflava TaxID=33053 RepID=UPI00209E8064|nr:tetratricopeptide repeat protein [Neisseria perflava]MCP1772788.1 putative O-linked N-acetylglucosamine transferase (SPINDLY family) [Neisseria perflava]
MSKKPRVPQKKAVAANPLLGELFQKSGVAVQGKPVAAPANPAAKQRYAELAKVWQQQGAAAALPVAQKAAAEFPHSGDILNLAGVVMAQSGQTQAALDLWQSIPDNQKTAAHYNNIGQASQKLGLLAQAEQNLRQSIKLQPKNNKDAWWNLGIVLQQDDKRIDEAIEAYRQILKFDANNTKVLANIAALYFNRQDHAHAAPYYDKLIALEPDNADALLNGAWAKRRLKEYLAATDYYRRGLALQPDNADGWFGLGKCLHFTLQFAEACAAIEKGLGIKPDDIGALVSLVLNRQYIVGQAEQVAKDSFRLGETYVKSAVKMPQISAKPKARLHIGVVSSDLRRHPVGLFAKAVLLSEEAKQFDWTAYANSEIYDEVSEEIRPIFKEWRNITELSDEEAAKQIEADGVDILLDLNGYTAGYRMGIFAIKPAPVQATWLGYFATSGLPNMDAILADPYCVPTSEEHLYSEKVYRLPHTRLCMQPTALDVEVKPLPALERGYITFACFQNLTKVNDEVLQLWAKIAKQVPTAHWRFQTMLLAEGSEMLQPFKDKLAKLGFPMDQVSCHGTTHYSEYFPTYNQVDLILDTFPYPGGTTTVDALWMGVPTISLAQPGMLARQGQQVLSAAGFPEFVCQNEADYIAQALYWCDPAHRDELNALRLGMREKAAASPIFDGNAFAADWCEVVKQIWADACERA